MLEQNAEFHARSIHVNGSSQPEKYCSNVISTCKYSVLSFFPRFLTEQFRRYSNIFFLVIALLQQIPDVSPTGRYTTAVPFFLILSVSAIKEIFEDIKRRKSDQKVNNFWTLTLRHNTWEGTRWQKVRVGDILRVENNQMFPADMVLLSSSEPSAMAYIETSNLDGETNLKIRQGLECTANLTNLVDIANFRCDIECEQPNRNLNDFTGTLHLSVLQRPLSVNQLLLRGARLKNTQWICGAVIYTGHDAKLLLNSKTAPLKHSNIDRITNRRIIFLFIVLIGLAIASAVGAHFYELDLLVQAYYLGLSGSKTTNFFWNVLTFFILYNNLIPISLQVTLELVRFFQAFYINNDIKMYDEVSDTAAVARTSNLMEELGQVKFVMSDKTGTLTRNVMKFKKCTIAGENFGNDENEEFNDTTLVDAIKRGDAKSDEYREFLRMMAVCHTVVPERDEEGKIQYQASSPDEGALVRGAAALGYIFHTRKPRCVIVKELGKDKNYEVLNVLEFTSDRKRMGVIVRCRDNKLKLYVKGADTVILERLQKGTPYVDECFAHLSEYASKGYRTLCFAMKILDESTYQPWAKEFEEASVALEKRAEKLADCAQKIEKDLILLGASAIEDKLQDHVPETIRALLRAEIRVWMLTGDKRETAVNIARAASLCTSNTTLLLLSTTSYDETYSQLNILVNNAQLLDKTNTEFALVIDGNSLHHALTGGCRELLGELSFTSKAVICCRMTPMQKAEVVDLVKSAGEDVVLAIGDGANDVAMIQAANVGIGISGEEGLQAASASDYAIAQFRFLQRLLLVHGAWNYDRGVKVILYSFYKNICLYLIELWFALYSAFSGQTVFERWTIGLFNVAFTAFPPIILGLFDRPVSDDTMIAYPALYFSFQKRAFTVARFGFWIGTAILHSLLLYFLSFAFLYDPVVWSDGRVGGWLMLGNSCYTFVVATVCLKSLLECDSWTVAIVYSCVGSILLWMLFLAVYSLVWPTLPIGDDMTGMAYIMTTSGSFWLAFLLIPVTSLLTDFVFKVCRSSYCPTPRELACFHERSKADRFEKCLELTGLRRRTYSIEREHLSGQDNEAMYGSTIDLESAGIHIQPVRGQHEVLKKSEPTSQRRTFVENARLLDVAEGAIVGETEARGSIQSTRDYGYAFSQEENGVVPQSTMIRSYDSTSEKPHGR